MLTSQLILKNFKNYFNFDRKVLIQDTTTKTVGAPYLLKLLEKLQENRQILFLLMEKSLTIQLNLQRSLMVTFAVCKKNYLIPLLPQRHLSLMFIYQSVYLPLYIFDLSAVEVFNTISQLNSNVSCGFDEIETKFVNIAAEIIVLY